jgi:hypothetical protein
MAAIDAMMEALEASRILARTRRMASIFSAVVVADIDTVLRPSIWTEHMSIIAVKNVPSLVACGQMVCCMVF